jgi:putative ATPase
MKKLSNFVNGKSVDSTSGETTTLVNPATGQPLATAPKSNAVNVAISEARQDVNSGNIGLVPPPLRDGATPFGASGDYLYPHDYPEGVFDAKYATYTLVWNNYYSPTAK